jgi:short-subunit dehydrogenase involved in D-alanine esterification of teichoic acids
MNFKESTVLITGAGTGMGLEAAKYFQNRTAGWWWLHETKQD